MQGQRPVRLDRSIRHLPDRASPRAMYIPAPVSTHFWRGCGQFFATLLQDVLETGAPYSRECLTGTAHPCDGIRASTPGVE